MVQKLLEKVYIMTFKDAMSSGAKTILVGLGAPVLDPYELERLGMPEAHERSELIAVTVHDGAPFPDKPLRVSRSFEHAEQRGFFVPDIFSTVLRRQLVPVLTVSPSLSMDERFKTALADFHADQSYKQVRHQPSYLPV